MKIKIILSLLPIRNSPATLLARLTVQLLNDSLLNICVVFLLLWTLTSRASGETNEKFEVLFDSQNLDATTLSKIKVNGQAFDSQCVSNGRRGEAAYQYKCNYVASTAGASIHINVKDTHSVNYLTSISTPPTWDSRNNFTGSDIFLNFLFYKKTQTGWLAVAPQPQLNNQGFHWVFRQVSPINRLKITSNSEKIAFEVSKDGGPGEIRGVYPFFSHAKETSCQRYAQSEPKDLKGNICQQYFNFEKINVRQKYEVNFNKLSFSNGQTHSSSLEEVLFNFSTSGATPDKWVVKQGDFYCYLGESETNEPVCGIGRLEGGTPFISCYAGDNKCYITIGDSLRNYWGIQLRSLNAKYSFFDSGDLSVNIQLKDFPAGPVAAKVSISSTFNGRPIVHNCPPMVKSNGAPGEDTPCSIPIDFGAQFGVKVVPTGQKKYKWMSSMPVYNSEFMQNSIFFRVPVSDTQTPLHYNVELREGNPNPPNPNPPNPSP